MSTSVTYNERNPPLVSIALCTYNGEKFLHQQIDSLLAQTYTNIEIVAVDDASADSTRTILEEKARKDNRFRFFINDSNLGYNRNFEKSISLCNGAYVAISDQDDIWEFNKIERMMNLWPPGSSFIYSLSGNFTENDFANRTAAPQVIYTDIDDVHKLVFNSPVHGHACMFKKEMVEKCTPFPEDIFYDWWMSMHAAATGIIGCVPETLTWHRVHQSNSSRNITAIKEKELRNEQLRKQCIHFIETFCSRNILNGEQLKSLMEYVTILKTLDGKKFSWPMFWYVLRNRNLVFHYKKPKPFRIISSIKHSARMGYKGLL